MCLASHRPQTFCKWPHLIDPTRLISEARRFGERAQPFNREFVRRLRPDRFAGFEMNLDASARDFHAVPVLRPEMHLNTLLVFVPTHFGVKGSQIEVRAELTVDPGKQVQ